MLVYPNDFNLSALPFEDRNHEGPASPWQWAVSNILMPKPGCLLLVDDCHLVSAQYGTHLEACGRLPE